VTLIDKDLTISSTNAKWLWSRSKIVNREPVERNSVKVWHWRGAVVRSRPLIHHAPKNENESILFFIATKWKYFWTNRIKVRWNWSAIGTPVRSLARSLARSLRFASPRLVSPCLATCTIPETRESVGRLSPQSSDGMQEERSEQNASSRSVQNHRFQVQLSHSRAPWSTKRRHCPAGAVPVHLQLTDGVARKFFVRLFVISWTFKRSISPAFHGTDAIRYVFNEP